MTGREGRILGKTQFGWLFSTGFILAGPVAPMPFSTFPHHGSTAVRALESPAGNTGAVIPAMPAFWTDAGSPGKADTPAALRCTPFRKYPGSDLSAFHEDAPAFPKGQGQFVPGRFENPSVGGAGHPHGFRCFLLVHSFEIRQPQCLDLVQTQPNCRRRINFMIVDGLEGPCGWWRPHHSASPWPSSSSSLFHGVIFEHSSKKHKGRDVGFVRQKHPSPRDRDCIATRPVSKR